MRRAALRFDFIIFLIGILFLCLAGCSSNHTVTANKLNADIHNETAAINKAVTEAETHIDSADHKLASASTQPSVLAGARGDLKAAKGALAAVPGHTTTIDSKSDQAAQETKKAVDEKKKIEDSIGYRIQVWLTRAFWTFCILAPILGIAGFLLKTNGGGPILSALGEVAGNCISAVWAVLKFVGKAIFHVVTLGLVKLGDITNKHWDKQEEAKKVGTNLE